MYEAFTIPTSPPFIEIIPLVLGIIAVILASIKLKDARRTTDKVAGMLFIVSATLLIVGQAQLWAYSFLNQTATITWLFDKLWVIHDTLLMTSVIVLLYPRLKQNETPPN